MPAAAAPPGVLWELVSSCSAIVARERYWGRAGSVALASELRLARCRSADPVPKLKISLGQVIDRQ